MASMLSSFGRIFVRKARTFVCNGKQRVDFARSSPRTKVLTVGKFWSTKPWGFLVTSLVMVRSLSFFGKADPEVQDDSKTKKSKVADDIRVADILYSHNKHIDVLDVLYVHKDQKNDEILWRLARATYEKSKLAQGDEEKKALLFEAYGYVKEALEINDGSFAAHKWMSILLDKVSAYKGTKERIIQSPRVKEHMMRAIKLNPNDATTNYLLGYWCYSVADLPWYQRQIASAVFATPPTSSFEEAIEYFITAENIDPYFYSMNLLMMGKTFLKLGDQENAKKYLVMAKSYAPITEEDREAAKEASRILQGL